MRGATPSGTEKKKRRPLGPAFSNPFDRQSPPRKKRQQQQPLGPAFANPFDQAQPPDRTLAHLGINKTVPEFNDALMQLHTAFTDAYRKLPSPGLALDVLRSPLEPHEFPKLFTVPESNLQAQAQGTRLKHQADNPEAVFYRRPDGFLDLHTPLNDLLAQQTNFREQTAGTYVLPGDHPGLVEPGNINYSQRKSVKNADGSVSTVRTIGVGFNGLQYVIPTVINGRVVSDKAAIEHFRKTGEHLGAFKTVAQSNRYAEQLHLEEQKRVDTSELPTRQNEKRLTPEQLHSKYPWVSVSTMGVPLDPMTIFSAMKTLSSAQLDPNQAQVLMQGGETLQHYTARAELAARGSVLDKQGFALPPTSPKLKTASEAGQKFLSVANAQKTVKGFQGTLKTYYPGWFNDLPSDGNFNRTWGSRFDELRRTAQFAKTSTEQIASSEGLSVSDFIQAWHNKQQILKKHPMYYQVVSTLPLRYLVHPKSLTGSSTDLLKGLTSGISFKHNWYDYVPIVPSIKLLSNTAGLGMELLGGSVDQYKAWGEAMGIAMHHTGELWTSNKKTKGELEHKLTTALTGNPTWMEMVKGLTTGDPTIPKGKAWALTNKISNVLGDILLLGGKGNYGPFLERAPQNMTRVLGHRYFQGATDMSYRELLNAGENGTYQAAKMLGGGRGAEQLASLAAKDAKAGKLTLEEYRQLAARAYTNMEPEYKGQAIYSDMLSGLGAKKLPTSFTGWKRVQQAVRTSADNMESSTGVAGKSLNGFLSGVRSAMQHAVPRGEKNFFEPMLPQRVYDYTRQTFKDTKLANKWSSELVALRAKNDAPGIQDLFQRIDDRYHIDFPKGKGTTEKAPFDALFLTEMPSRGFLPTGGEPELTGVFDRLAVQAKHLNRNLNKGGRLLRRTVVSGAPVPGVAVPGFGLTLFEKHATADLFRALNAGMFPVRDRPALLEGRRLLGDYLDKTPAAKRLYETSVLRSEQGEVRYMLGQSATDIKDFNTGEVLAKYPGLINKGKREAHMIAASRYTRHMLDDEALGALTASTADNLKPLEAFLGKHPDYRRIAFSKAPPVQESMGPGWFTTGEGEKAVEPAKAAFSLQAQAMYKRYQDFVKAGQEAGFRDPVAEAKASYATVRAGGKDKALAKWIDSNKVSFDVNAGLVKNLHPLEDWNSHYIGMLMSPNKLYRRTLFQNLTAKMVADMHAAAPEASMDNLLRTAASTSEQMVKHHMLDFSNMLKVEQDFRWASWFATKHRLYWKYLTGLMVREPKWYVVAHDLSKELDKNGNLKLNLWGAKFAIPIYRLTWLNSRDLPDVSTFPLTFGAGIAKGIMSKPKSPLGILGSGFSEAGSTGGNIFTRDDQTLLTLAKMAPFWPKTFEAATAGMTPTQVKQFNRSVNVFQAKHPHVSEADAVKYGLHQFAWRQALQSNTAIPTILGYDPKKTNDMQKLWLAFGDLKTGTQKRNFLDKHPELATQIGQTKDPAVYHHLMVFRPRMDAVTQSLDRQLEEVQNSYQETGVWTPKLEAQYRSAHKDYSKALDRLLVEDAKTWAGSSSLSKGVVREGLVVKPGPLGKQLEGNPLLARQELDKYTSIPGPELRKHTIGQTMQELQGYVDFLKKKGNKIFGEESTRTQLTKAYARLNNFYGYPQDAPGRYHDAYYKIVDAYRKQRDHMRSNIKANLSSDVRDRAYEELRAFVDAHDKRVPVTVGGKTIMFPSPVKLGFALAPAAQREQQDEQWLADNWAHLPRYAKAHLGRPVSDKVTKGWLAYSLYFSALQHNDQHAIKRLNKQFNITDVKALPIGVEIRKQGKYDYHKIVAKWVDQQLGAKGAFVRDYNFSKQPKLKQLQQIPGVAQSDRYQHMLSVANDFLNKRGYAHAPSNVRNETWRRYDGAELEAWFKAQPKWFQNGLGPNFVNSLVANG